MKIPTADELKMAQEAIRQDGPAAPATIALSLLCIKEPLTREVVDRIAAATGTDAGVLMGAFVAGLNLGLRVSNGQ